MRFKKVVIISLSITALFLSTGNLNAESGVSKPGKIVVNAIEKGLEILKNSSLTKVEKKQELWAHLESYFDFKAISKRALGPHWRNRSNEEQEKFTTLFTSILKKVYLDKTSSYTGEKVVYIGELIQGDRAKVQTNVITNKGKKISVDFSMHKISENWKVYDVAIEGVSLVNNYRSQFNSILSKSSFEDLLEKLREKEKN